MIDYHHPEVGAFHQGNSVTTFIVWAPERKTVEVAIADRMIGMEKNERGYWRTTQQSVSPGTPYKFRLDGRDSFPDPASLSQPQGVHGPSLVVDRSFPWTDSAWTGIALEDMILYELHIGTFSPSGDFDGAMKRLGYLQDLGVNAIELMPVAQFPGNRNWGYDGVYPFAVQHSYGGADGLKRLVDEAHRQGIAVVLDVVYNHLGPEGNYLGEYAPYFTERYRTPWGKAINLDDAWCDGVRHYYWQNALMWLNDFHIDGLRLDAVHALWDSGARHFVEELKAKVNALALHTGRKKILIAEFDLNNPRYINPPAKGGYGLDGQWTDEFHHALHAVVTGERGGYYEDFGEVSHVAKAYRDSYVYTGQYSVHRKKNFGVLPVDNPYGQFVVFAQNHDQIGNRLPGDRLTTSLSGEGLKLMAAAYLLSPSVPMLFMGEEYGEKNPFQYFISHTDAALVKMVREGRKKEFAYFAWEGDVPDPQDEKTFRQCVLSWKTDDVLLAYYTFLIGLRKTKKAMLNRERSSVIVLPVHERIVCFERIFGQDHVLIVLNFAKQVITIPSPLQQNLRKIFDSSSRRWNGPGEVCPDDVPASGSIDLNPESVLLFDVL